MSCRISPRPTCCHYVNVHSGVGTWSPMKPAEVSEVLAGLHSPWWIAGGWAIDLHVGHQTREHADIDVLVLREDLLPLQAALAGWELYAADPPGCLRAWREGEVLSVDVHDVWCRRSPTSPWCLQVMIDDAQEGRWIYRHDPRIHRPIEELDGPASNSKRRVLAPEVQLLQKSRDPRPKDEADLLAIRPHLGERSTEWLRTSLASVSPGHPWLKHL